MDKETIISSIGQILWKYLEPEGLIIFFGSLIKGNFTRTSDIDVAIYSTKDIPARLLLQMKEELESLPLPKEIDLIDLKRVHSADFIERILQEGYLWKSSEEALKSLQEHLKNLKKP